MKADYFEIHVVVADPTKSKQTTSSLSSLALRHGFWTSTLTHDESGEEVTGDVIATTRSPLEAVAAVRIRDFVVELQSNGFRVTRYKIEHVVLDSKTDDVLNLLRGSP